MTYHLIGPKRPVELLLSEDLVREIADKVGDVSEVVEQSLCLLVDLRSNQPNANHEAYYNETVAMGIRFYKKHGVWGEEFSTL